jgi:hypothetical protein
MQTLNVGAGRTDLEYKEAQERRREELREDSQSDANYFFYAAGLAAISSGVLPDILPVRINFLINFGMLDLLRLYGRRGSVLDSSVALGTVVLWVIVMCALGFAARKGYRWAFLVGIALYGADMAALMATFSIWAFGVHGFFVFRWFQGQRALKELRQASN